MKRTVSYVEEKVTQMIPPEVICLFIALKCCFSKKKTIRKIIWFEKCLLTSPKPASNLFFCFHVYIRNWLLQYAVILYNQIYITMLNRFQPLPNSTQPFNMWRKALRWLLSKSSRFSWNCLYIPFIMLHSCDTERSLCLMAIPLVMKLEMLAH